MEEVKDTIFEVREEKMISSTFEEQNGPILTTRNSHFLRPIIDKALKNLPPHPLSLSSNNNSVCLEQLFLNTSYCAWRLEHKQWNKWVDTMHNLHQETWRKCGIYEAILCSKLTIRKQIDLLFGVAEKWCIETNTFVFPWGEATITLEDMLVLGGFSVLGDSVLDPIEIAAMKSTVATLIESYYEIKRETGHHANPNKWIKHFTSTESMVEHEAFLCLWLSKYVFPYTKYDSINPTVFSAAVRLARGIRIALAQPVLARIYQDLGTLKDRIVHSKKQTLKLCAQLHLVQVWVWERFLSLRPKPHLIESDEPRLARWNELKIMRVDNVRLVLDSEGEDFQWRPYVAKKGQSYFSKLYRENEGWVLNVAESDTNSEVESFARCVRVSELVGIDHCIELYLPHRVARQFGLDQDVPDYDVSRFNKNPKMRPIREEKVFIPSRLFEADVTKRYFDWWVNSKSVQQLAMPVQDRRKTWSESTTCTKEPRQADVAAENNDDEQLIDNHSLNAVEIHVGPLLDGAPRRIPSPCNTTHDSMELEENYVDVLEYQGSEIVVMESEEVASALVTQVVEAHEAQDSCLEARVQSDKFDQLEELQTQAMSSHTINEPEGVAHVKESEAVVAESCLQVKIGKEIKKNGKEIEVIDLESYEFEGRHGYKVFRKSNNELAARISRVEEMVVAVAKIKTKRKCQKKATGKSNAYERFFQRRKVQ